MERFEDGVLLEDILERKGIEVWMGFIYLRIPFHDNESLLEK